MAWMHAKEKETERFGIQEAGREDTSDCSDRNIFEDFVTFWYKSKFVIVWVVYGRYPDEPEMREVVSAPCYIVHTSSNASSLSSIHL
jgi:hypothetical protein